MRQWSAAKRENPDALLFFRMGDFYELFYDDAAVASRELQLTLTARDKDRQIPMCGVPFHAVEGYLTRLLRKGYRIALCDQMEDPKLTKKIVRREVTRVLSPGTALDAGLGQEQNNFLAALFEVGPSLKRTIGANATVDSANSTYGPKSVPFKVPEIRDRKAAIQGESICAVALLDVSTGEFRTAEFNGANARAQAVDEILLSGAREVLVASSAELPVELERIPARTRVEDWVWTHEFAVPLVERQLNVRSLEGFGLNGHEAAAIAAGAVLHYVRTTQKNEALHIDSLKFEEHSTALELDAGDGAESRTCRTAVCRPGRARHAVSHAGRLPDADGQAAAQRVRFCVRSTMRRKSRRAMKRWPRRMATCSSARRCAGRSVAFWIWSGCWRGCRWIRRGRATCARWRQAWRGCRACKNALRAMTAPLWRDIAARLDTLDDVTARIARTLVAEPPLTLADGGAIAAGVDAELDDLRTISTHRAAGDRGHRGARAAADRDRLAEGAL